MAVNSTKRNFFKRIMCLLMELHNNINKVVCKEKKKSNPELDKPLHLTINLRKYKGQKNMLTNTTGMKSAKPRQWKSIQFK